MSAIWSQGLNDIQDVIWMTLKFLSNYIKYILHRGWSSWREVTTRTGNVEPT